MSDTESDRPIVLSDLRALRDEIANNAQSLASTLRAEMASNSESLASTLRAEVANVSESIVSTLRDEMKKQSEEDRRHFKMLAEDVRDSVRIVAEATAHNTARLGDHEIRLRKIEKRR